MIDGKIKYGLSMVLFWLILFYFWRSGLLSVEAEIDKLSEKINTLNDTLEDNEKTTHNSPFNTANLTYISVFIMIKAIVILLIVYIIYACLQTIIRLLNVYKMPQTTSIGIDAEGVDTWTSSDYSKFYNNIDPAPNHDHDTFPKEENFMLSYLKQEAMPVLISVSACAVCTSMYQSFAVDVKDLYNTIKLKAHVRSIYIINLVVFTISFIFARNLGTFVSTSISKAPIESTH